MIEQRARYRVRGASARVLATGLLVVMLLGVAGCGSGADTSAGELDPPAQAVDSLLTLRYERSTDASAYADFIEEGLATELARASQEETGDIPPTPQWETPYVSAGGTGSTDASSTADVVVVWKDRTDYPEWPPATVFTLSMTGDGRWLASDARTVGETETVPPPSE